MDRIRDEEARTTWTSELEERLGDKLGTTVYPGMMFGLAKDKMEKTKLWKIVRKMPKGALLHAHMDAMVDLDFILAQALDTPGMHIYCGQLLSSDEHRKLAPIQFKWLKSDHCKSTRFRMPNFH